MYWGKWALRFIIIIILVQFFASCSILSTKEVVSDANHDGEVRNVSLATGGTSGTYFAIGSGIAAIATKYVDSIEFTAESTGASVANCKLIRDGAVEFGLASASTVASAYNGREIFEGDPADNITGVIALYPEVFQLLVLKKSGLQEISDLEGKRVAIGTRESGTARIAKILLSAHGISLDDIDEKYMPFSEAVAALKDELIDCVIIGAGLPTSAVIDASASLEINLLEVDRKKMGEALKETPFLKFEVIPEGTYCDVNKDILTVSTPAILVASKNVEDQLVYEVTKAIFSNLSEIEGVHPQGRNINLMRALDAMPIPVHPGAEKYYREQGVID